MSRVLSGAALAPSARAVGPCAVIEPAAVRAQMDARSAQAYQDGRADGIADGRAQALGDADSLAARIRVAIRDEVEAAGRRRADDAAAIVRLAAGIARAVTAREPGPGGEALLSRIRDALAAVDDAPLRLAVSPGDASLVRAALEPDGIEVAEDPALPAGEAVVRGRWGLAEITADAAWQAVSDILGGGIA